MEKYVKQVIENVLSIHIDTTRVQFVHMCFKTCQQIRRYITASCKPQRTSHSSNFKDPFDSTVCKNPTKA